MKKKKQWKTTKGDEMFYVKRNNDFCRCIYLKDISD